MKAFVFTFDAIFALLFFTLLLALLVVSIAQPEIPRSSYLRQLSHDFLAVAQQENAFVNSLQQGDGSPLRDLFRRLPPAVCMQVHLIPPVGNQTVIADPSCTGYAQELQATWLPLYYNNSNYRIRLESWYRTEVAAG